MKKNVIKEIKKIIASRKLNCTVNEFENKANWIHVSTDEKLSEDFIREFKDKVIWHYISWYQKLSEDFIKEFKDKVIWESISCDQKLSENFIREFKDYVNWDSISFYQKLSEDFIREFKNKIDWISISCEQNLSEDFIRKFQDYVYWIYISSYQKLSKDFIREFKDKIDIKMQKANFKEKSHKEKLKEIKKYAKEHNLKFDGKYLYAYRNHDRNGCGQYNKTIIYEKGKYYTDCHCDMNPKNESSFGLGIFSKGNTSVKVKVEDWGVAVNNGNSKARVMGFKIL